MMKHSYNLLPLSWLTELRLIPLSLLLQSFPLPILLGPSYGPHHIPPALTAVDLGPTLNLLELELAPHDPKPLPLPDDVSPEAGGLNAGSPELRRRAVEEEFPCQLGCVNGGVAPNEVQKGGDVGD